MTTRSTNKCTPLRESNRRRPARPRAALGAAAHSRRALRTHAARSARARLAASRSRPRGASRRAARANRRTLSRAHPSSRHVRSPHPGGPRASRDGVLLPRRVLRVRERDRLGLRGALARDGRERLRRGRVRLPAHRRAGRARRRRAAPARRRRRERQDRRRLHRTRQRRAPRAPTRGRLRVRDAALGIPGLVGRLPRARVYDRFRPPRGRRRVRRARPVVSRVRRRGSRDRPTRRGLGGVLSRRRSRRRLEKRLGTPGRARRDPRRAEPRGDGRGGHERPVRGRHARGRAGGADEGETANLEPRLGRAVLRVGVQNSARLRARPRRALRPRRPGFARPPRIRRDPDRGGRGGVSPAEPVGVHPRALGSPGSSSSASATRSRAGEARGALRPGRPRAPPRLGRRRGGLGGCGLERLERPVRPGDSAQAPRGGRDGEARRPASDGDAVRHARARVGRAVRLRGRRQGTSRGERGALRALRPRLVRRGRRDGADRVVRGRHPHGARARPPGRAEVQGVGGARVEGADERGGVARRVLRRRAKDAAPRARRQGAEHQGRGRHGDLGRVRGRDAEGRDEREGRPGVPDEGGGKNRRARVEARDVLPRQAEHAKTNQGRREKKRRGGLEDRARRPRRRGGRARVRKRSGAGKKRRGEKNDVLRRPVPGGARRK